MKNKEQDGINQHHREPQPGRTTISDGLPANNDGHEAREERRAPPQAATEIIKKPTASSRKVEANRRNASRSTGHLFLPSKEDLDRLLRYEAMINKQLNHAIAELERLQGRRKGQSALGNLGSFAKQSQ